MNNRSYEKKPTKRKRKSAEERLLTRAVATLASIIESMASSMKRDLDNGEGCDIKHLKELTGSAKELSLLLGTMVSREKDGDDSRNITVLFEGESEKWAK